ncbi:baseplate hub protein [Rhodanobacter geophilus]|uniref:Uncharacterized protein n=1 Tax=Rhodanobacter geophilus TaxID=3162488 RepID=A0ABV3QR33_9GAMM
MSFAKRGLSFTIRLNAGDEQQGKVSNYQFDNGATALTLRGLRSRVTAQSCIGGDTAFVGQALIQIWGMKPEDMAQLSTLGFDMGKMGLNTISISAYGEGQANDVVVFSGGIFSAHINYNAMPDVCLELECSSTIGLQVQPIPGTSVRGAADVAAMLKGICAACKPPLNFVNNGVSAVLSNHACAGSPAQQIEDICTAAGVPYMISDGSLYVWKNGQNRDGVVIQTGSGMGLVGFPEYTMYGLDVTMEFNPEVQLGRMLSINNAGSDTSKAATAIPGVPGAFWINTVTHDLSCELPDGPWYTQASVSTIQIVGRN